MSCVLRQAQDDSELWVVSPDSYRDELSVVSCRLWVVGCELWVLSSQLSVMILRENSEYRVKKMWVVSCES